LSKPTILDSVGGYIFTWDEDKIRINVSRIKIHSDGTVKGEILIQATDSKIKHSHLHQAQFNFSSSSTRISLAKTLAQRLNSIDWYAILEQLSHYTLEKIRIGEPVQTLIAGDEIRPPEYILKPYIVRNYPTIIFGDRSGFKSTISLVLSQLVMLPWKSNLLGLNVPEKSVKCLYLDWETDRDTVLWQLTRLERGSEIGGAAIEYRKCALPLSQDLEQITTHIANTGAEIIFIDSLGPACGGDLKEAGSAISFFTSLRQLNTTAVILAHTSKDKETKHKSVFGSIFFEAQARVIWEIQKRQEADENEVDVALFNRKPPPFAGTHRPLGYKINFTDDSINISTSDPRTVGEFVDRMSAQERILQLLTEGQLSSKDIMERLEVNRNTLDSGIKRLRDRNKIVKVGDKWDLAYENQPSF